MNTYDTASPKAKARSQSSRQPGPNPVVAQTKPETFRLPSGRERDPHFGIGRSYWNGRILPSPLNNFKPEVKSYVIRRRGSRTGVRLIDFDSAMAFIKKHEEKSKSPTKSVAPHGAASENAACEAHATADQHPLGGRS